MSTENELTPGVPPRLHTISYPDLTATIQLNNAVSLLTAGKTATYGKLFLFYLYFTFFKYSNNF